MTAIAIAAALNAIISVRAALASPTASTNAQAGLSALVASSLAGMVMSQF